MSNPLGQPRWSLFTSSRKVFLHYLSECHLWVEWSSVRRHGRPHLNAHVLVTTTIAKTGTLKFGARYSATSDGNEARGICSIFAGRGSGIGRDTGTDLSSKVSCVYQSLCLGKRRRSASPDPGHISQANSQFFTGGEPSTYHELLFLSIPL